MKTLTIRLLDTRGAPPTGSCRRQKSLAGATLQATVGAVQRIVTLLFLLIAAPLHAAGFDAACSCRRPVTVTWDAEHATGRELASFECYTDGRSNPDGSDIHVTTEDGRALPTELLQRGPGDRLRVLFPLAKNIRDYDVYFGNPKAAPHHQTVPITSGLLMTMRQWNRAHVHNFESTERSYEQSRPELGRIMIPDLFLGFNPIDGLSSTISKTIGTVFAAQDGQYTFALAADRFAALSVDNQPLLFAVAGPSDTRTNQAIALTRGFHDITLYHVATNVDNQRFAVAWKTPGSAVYQIIGRPSFGTCFGGQAGSLQVRDQTINADFASTLAGLVEIGVDDAYQMRFKCLAHGVSKTTYRWDFGDGQTAGGAEVDHVYFTAGVYAVKLAITIGGNVETETRQLWVGPDYPHPINPPVADAKAAAAVVSSYDAATLPADALGLASKLLLQADQLDRATEFATAALRAHHHADAHAVVAAVSTISDALVAAGRVDTACTLWASAPVNADVQPRAAKRAADLALWGEGDFTKALTLLKPQLNRNDPSVKRMVGQALLLAGHAAEGTAILQKLPNQDAADKEAVLSGAFARSIDFYVRRNESDAGDDAWDRWQAKYPATFLAGYAVVLKAQLIALHGRPAVGAAMAAAFATAVPTSSYAPRLLDMASKWLAPTDPIHSNALRDRLKRNYPEDSLAQ